MRYVFEKAADGCTGAGPKSMFGPAAVHPSNTFLNTYLILIRDPWTCTGAPSLSIIPLEQFQPLAVSLIIGFTCNLGQLYPNTNIATLGSILDSQLS